MRSRTKFYERLGWIVFALCAAGLGILLSSSAHAATYYVSNSGTDTNSGTSPQSPWQTAAKVNATALQPGDIVLFARGGEWHERLAPTSSGVQGNRITFDAYGNGAKPKFWGSDVLDPAQWTTQGSNVYSYSGLNATVTEVLVNHGTGANGQWFNAGNPTSQAGTFDYNAGTLRINSATDPRSDGRVYTAVTRQDVVASNGRDHLVFKNLQGDECADPSAGYVFRVEGSQDVTLDTCDAYRGGRHNFGVINSTGFVGMNLYTAYAMPNINGGATFYVSYSGSESNYSNCTSTYVNCTGEHFEDGNGGAYQYFVCHGAKQGPIVFQNPIDKGGKFSILQENPAQSVTVTGGTILDADYELFCDNVLTDGVTLTGNSAIDCYSKNCIFQNLLLTINPNGGGPTGYGSAIVFRSGAQNNTVRFCTVAMDPSTGSDKPCLTFAASNIPTSWYGNVFISTGRAVADWGTLFNNNGTIPSGDVVSADYNYYATAATFNNQNFAAWQANGFADQHSLTGVTPFNNATGGDYTLKAGSTAIDAAAGVPAGNVPNHDFYGTSRPLGSGADMGAFEFNGNPALVITTKSLPDGTVGAAYATTLAATGGSGQYTWNIAAGALPTGLDLNASGRLSGTPTVEGTFNFSVRVQDTANASATRAWSLSIQKKTAVNHAPSINSGPTGNPGSGHVGDTISFSGSASDPDQDPLTYTWTYGDGASGSGAATAHVYTSAGTYTVTLTVTDPGLLSDHKSVTIVIAVALPPNNGGTDNGGAGGNDGSNSGSNPGGTNGGDSGGGASNGTLNLTVAKLRGGANFKLASRDTVTLSGVLPNVPPSFSPAGQTLVLDVGGATLTFTLDKNGRAKTGLGSIALKLNGKKFKSGDGVTFVATLRNGAWAADWGIDPTTSQSGSMTMLVTIQLAGNTYASSVSLTYSSKAQLGAKFRN